MKSKLEEVIELMEGEHVYVDIFIPTMQDSSYSTKVVIKHRFFSHSDQARSLCNTPSSVPKFSSMNSSPIPSLTFH